MEISIILTILLMIISLGRLHLQEGKICLITTVRLILKLGLFAWAVKFILKHLYSLNIVTLNDVQKAIKTTLIQPQNLKFEG
ncbi:hypothetical protein [Falsiporphyromonas endometrii]|uniref:Uncharacterized protein n=1 Tax=Falsiporphyromonas endometrii TaxID=1387297 RepID=A0ABV9K7N5_9PORP